MDSAAIKRTTLAVAMITSFITPFMGAAANIALPRISADLNMDAILLSWVASGYLLAAAVFLLPAGRLADIVGRKRIFSGGVLLFLAGSILVAISWSATLLIAARVVQGLGGGMVFGTSNAMLTSVFPAGERGRAIGWNTGAVYLGLSMGPPLGGWMVQHLDWRSIFVLNAVLCLLILVLIARLRFEWQEAAEEPFDKAGALTYGVGIIAIMYGFSALPGAKGALSLVAGLLILALFLRRESRTAFPLLDVTLLRQNRVFAFSNLAALINYSATFAVGFLLSLYLQYVKGLSPQMAGLLLMAQPIVMTLVAPLAGHLSDSIEPRWIASLGMGLTALGLFTLLTIDAHTSTLHLIISLMILGSGFGLFSSPNTNAIMGAVERRQLGVASAMVGTMRLVGQMLSMGVATLIIAVQIGHTPIHNENLPDFLKGMHLLLLIFAMLSLLGILASLARGGVQRGIKAQPGGSP